MAAKPYFWNRCMPVASELRPTVSSDKVAQQYGERPTMKVRADQALRSRFCSRWKELVHVLQIICAQKARRGGRGSEGRAHERCYHCACAGTAQPNQMCKI